MSDFRRVTDDFSTAPQISVADVAEAARLGFTTIINNRPDGEAPGQPRDARPMSSTRGSMGSSTPRNSESSASTWPSAS